METERTDGMTEWQPIETAPRDGTLILVGNEYGWWAAKYQEFAQSGYRFPNPWQSMLLNHRHMKGCQHLDPTHWMLPTPPAGNEA